VTPRAWPADDWRGRILVIRLSSLGDVVLTTGPLRVLRRRRPDLAVDVLTRRAYAPALRGLPTIDRVLVEEAPPEDRPELYTVALDWQGGAKGARAAARFAPGARRLAHPRASLHRRLLVLAGRRIPSPQPYVARIARTVSGAWLPRGELGPEAPQDPPRADAMRRRLERAASPPEGWLALGPSASRALKAIPAELADAIAERFRREGWGIARVAPPDDGAEPAGFLPLGPGEVRVAGPLEDVIALLASVRLFVGSDSGILHLATAVGTPALGLYGCTAPELGFSPLGNAAALGVDLPCRPCHVHGARHCWLGHRACWTSFPVERVRDEAAALLSRAGVPA
jgi:ADP-heptose:LPS heptosyltransferase